MYEEELTPSDIWWSVLSGPTQIVKKILSNLLKSRSVILRLTLELSWPEELRNVIERQLQNHDLSMDYVNAENDDTDLEPGKYLLRRFGNREQNLRYRDNSGISIGDYLKENRLLQNRIIWLHDLPPDRIDRWIDFCRSYRSQQPSDGLLILEASGLDTHLALPKHLVLIDCRQSITDYDVLILTTMLIMEGPLNSTWTRYVSHLASLFFPNDAEAATDFVLGTDFLHEDPVESVRRLVEGPYADSTRGIKTTLGCEEHAFSLVRTGNDAELYKRVWKAQVYLIFPLIEELQTYLIKRHEQRIQESLDQAGPAAWRFGKQVTDPYEVDLGLMMHLANQTIGDSSIHLLYLPKEDYTQVYFLLQCRNNLAHMKCCAPEDLKRLFESEEQTGAR